MNRRVKVFVTAELFDALFVSPRWHQNEAPFPIDTKLVGCQWNPKRWAFELVFEHPSFAEAAEGAEPVVTVRWRARED